MWRKGGIVMVGDEMGDCDCVEEMGDARPITVVRERRWGIMTV